MPWILSTIFRIGLWSNIVPFGVQFYHEQEDPKVPLVVFSYDAGDTSSHLICGLYMEDIVLLQLIENIDMLTYPIAIP